MEHLSDLELVNSYRKGADGALSVLIQRHIAAVHRFLYRMVGDRHLAEDLTQETFLKVWKHLPKYDSSKSFTTWVFSIAKNTAIDSLRKKNPIAFSNFESEEKPDMGAAIPDERPLPDELLERKELAAYLEEALTELAPNARAVVLMHETEDMTFQEIADAMDEPMNTIKSRYRRATETLRKYLRNRLE